MIKSELRSLVFNATPRIDDFHPRLIDAAIESALKEMLWEVFAVDPMILQRYTVRYGISSPVTVSYNGTLGIYTSTLPAAIVPFPDKASGLRRISTISQAGLNFFPIDAREIDLLGSGSYASTVNNKIGYVVYQTTVDYYGMSASIASSGVRMDIIQPFSVYSDTDTVLIPELRDNQGDDIVTRSLRILQTVQPFEQIDDNAVEQPKANK